MKSLVEEAIDTAHKQCEPFCKHAEEFADHVERMKKEARESFDSGIKSHVDPLASVYYDGIHVGLRLAELRSNTAQTNPSENWNNNMGCE